MKSKNKDNDLFLNTSSTFDRQKRASINPSTSKNKTNQGIQQSKQLNVTLQHNLEEREIKKIKRVPSFDDGKRREIKVDQSFKRQSDNSSKQRIQQQQRKKFKDTIEDQTNSLKNYSFESQNQIQELNKDLQVKFDTINQQIQELQKAQKIQAQEENNSYLDGTLERQETTIKIKEDDNRINIHSKNLQKNKQPVVVDYKYLIKSENRNFKNSSKLIHQNPNESETYQSLEQENSVRINPFIGQFPKHLLSTRNTDSSLNYFCPSSNSLLSHNLLSFDNTYPHYNKNQFFPPQQEAKSREKVQDGDQFSQQSFKLQYSTSENQSRISNKEDQYKSVFDTTLKSRIQGNLYQPENENERCLVEKEMFETSPNRMGTISIHQGETQKIESLLLQEKKVKLEFLDNEISLKQKRYEELKDFINKCNEELDASKKLAQRQKLQKEREELELDQIAENLKIETKKLKLIQEERIKEEKALAFLKGEVISWKEQAEKARNLAEKEQVQLEKIDKEKREIEIKLITAEKSLSETEAKKEELKIIIRQQTEQLDFRLNQLTELQIDVERERQKVERSAIEADRTQSNALKMMEQNGQREQQLDIIERELTNLQNKLEKEQNQLTLKSNHLEERKIQLDELQHSAIIAQERVEKEREDIELEKEIIQNQTARMQSQFKEKEKMLQEKESIAVQQARMIEDQLELKEQGLLLTEQLWQKKYETEQRDILLRSSKYGTSLYNSAATTQRKNNPKKEYSSCKSSTDFCSRKRSTSLLPTSALKLIPNNQNQCKQQDQKQNYLEEQQVMKGRNLDQSIVNYSDKKSQNVDMYSYNEDASREYRFKKSIDPNSNCITILDNYKSGELTNLTSSSSLEKKTPKNTYSFRNYMKK